jgi:hypothetical protein
MKRNVRWDVLREWARFVHCWAELSSVPQAREWQKGCAFIHKVCVRNAN